MKCKIMMLVIVVSAFISLKLFANVEHKVEQDASKEIVFLEGNKLMYMSDMDKDEAPICIMEIDPSTTDNMTGYSIQLSEDGKYVYFFDEDDEKDMVDIFNEEEDTGTLYYIKLDALTKDEDKNQEYIHKVDTEVGANFRVIGNEQIIYIKDNDKLIYYDGSDPKMFFEHELADNVEDFGYDDKVNRINYVKNNGDSSALYYYDLVKETNYKIDGNMRYAVTLDCSEFLIFINDVDEKNQMPLCYATLDGTVKVVDENCEEILDYDSENKCIYFTKEHINTQSLYDLIDDTFAEADAAITESQTEASLQCQERNALREALKAESFETEDREIYCYQNGKLMKLAENTGDLRREANAKSHLVSYLMLDDNDLKVAIDEITNVDDVWERIREEADDAKHERKYLLNGKELNIGDDLYIEMNGVSEDGKYVVANQSLDNEDNKNAAYLYEIKNGKLTNKQELTKAYGGSIWDGEILYYSELTGDTEHGEKHFYKYENGKKIKLLSAKPSSVMCIYEDGQYIVADSAFYGRDGKLYPYNTKGSKKGSGTDIILFSYINRERIVYTENGNLYVYTGSGESKCISKNVTQYSCMAQKITKAI